MSRLLFAAARGARVISNHTDVPASLMWINNAVEHGVEYRIHPDDLHLQYGPISTALRIFGMGGDDPYTLPSLLALDVYLHEKTDFFDDNFANSLFLLILAEALADSGL